MILFVWGALDIICWAARLLLLLRCWLPVARLWVLWVLCGCCVWFVWFVWCVWCVCLWEVRRLCEVRMWGGVVAGGAVVHGCSVCAFREVPTDLRDALMPLGRGYWWWDGQAGRSGGADLEGRADCISTEVEGDVAGKNKGLEWQWSCLTC
jgi:hypothetical protein